MKALAPGYRIVSRLSRGRVLDTYEVWSDERECVCVAKVVRPDRLDRPRDRQRLLAEGRLLARLSHPHIVRAYELIERPRAALILEALTGDTLAHLIEDRRRRLPAADVAALGLHLCSALSYLHRQGYVHLDLKPSNVVCDAGQAKLIDFSIARLPGRAPRAIGSRPYMAPEQARGGAVGPAADVWGLGAVLFEAAAGRRPFAGRGGNGRLPQLDGRADRVGASRRLPRVLAAAIDACLDPDPEARPALAELAAVLDPLA